MRDGLLVGLEAGKEDTHKGCQGERHDEKRKNHFYECETSTDSHPLEVITIALSGPESSSNINIFRVVFRPDLPSHRQTLSDEFGGGRIRSRGE